MNASQNVIAGNLGRGIQVRGDLLPVGIQPQDHSNSILANLIGLGAGGSAVQTVGAKSLSLGNLSEGIEE